MGYKLTLIEVGQVAQNITLACQELGICSCEFGGLLNTQLESELELDKSIKLFLGLSIGYEQTEPSLVQISDNNLEKIVYEHLIGPKKLISKTKLFTNKESSNFISICYFGENQSKISGATSTSPEFAKFKSVIEAFERSRTELLHVDFVGTANSLIGKEHLDPQANNPLSIAQIKKNGNNPF